MPQTNRPTRFRAVIVFANLLDRTQTNDPNTITWTDETNTDCVGDVLYPGDGGVLPTP